ncbi:MAG: glycosyltransferase [Bacteroidia bacterium]|nr:glycosyltransferase [Bacteroidia bacterium]
MGKYFLKTCQGFLSMSKAVCDDLRTLGMKQPMTLTPHPMYDIYGDAVPREEALKQLGLSDQYSYLLFFGFVRKYKGLDLLLQAFAKVSNPALKLIIAGEYYEDASYYEELIQKHNLTNRIIHYGRFIEDKEVPLFFSAANLLVQPYRSATQSGVAQIAYFYNLPMIVTNVGGLAEIVPDGKTGYCVNPDSEEIAHAIEKYFEQKQESVFRQAITTEKKRFTWQTFTASINELKQQIEQH